MSAHRLDLTRPLLSGLYELAPEPLDRLMVEARRAELAVCRVDLSGCRDKAALLHCMAVALHLPPEFGDNWDALADSLRDPVWQPAWGHVLRFDHAEALRDAAPHDFAVLRGVLDDAATFAMEHDRPFFAFFSLPDHAVDAADSGA